MKINSPKKLPKDIQDEIKERLLNHDTIDAIKSWLDDKGYDISRSSLGRYSIDNRAEILSLRKGQVQDESYLSFRMDCLRAAVEFNNRKIDTTVDDVLEIADDFYKWLYK